MLLTGLSPKTCIGHKFSPAGFNSGMQSFGYAL